MKTNIRIEDTTLEYLRLLKDYTGDKSYDEIIRNLVRKELSKYYVRTKSGYVTEGAVVKDGDKVLVIKSVTEDRVVFDDSSYAFNGSRATWNLEILAESVEELGKGRLNE